MFPLWAFGGPLEENAKQIQKLAEQGDAKAQSHLGYLYYVGEGVTQDYSKAVEWYRKAATQGDKDAQYNLAVAYAFGEGIKQDLKEAGIWYRRSAEQGHVISQYSLGLSYAYGEGVPQDPAEAVRWFEKAAEQGYIRAQVQLGSAYHTGEGVSQDYSKAIDWYRMAADRGDATAQYNLGTLYRSGKGVEQNYQQAIRWFTMAADQGYAAAQNELASLQRTAGRVATRPTPQLRPGSDQTSPGIAATSTETASVSLPTETTSPIATVENTVEEEVSIAQTPAPTSSLKSGDGISKPTTTSTGETGDSETGTSGKGGLFGAIGSIFKPVAKEADVSTAITQTPAAPDSIDTASGTDQPVEEEPVEVISNVPQTDSIVRSTKVEEGSVEATEEVLAEAAEDKDNQPGFFSRLFGSRKESPAAADNDQLALVDSRSPVGPSSGQTTSAQADKFTVAAGRQALERGKYEEAVKQFRPLAEAGDPDAQSHLASMYYVGRAVDKDYKQAFSWYRRAAEQGHVDSQYSLGNMYLLGEGVQQNNHLAALWYNKAAQQGHVAASHNLLSLKRMLEQTGETIDIQEETEVAALAPVPREQVTPQIVAEPATGVVTEERAAEEPSVPVTSNVPQTDKIVRTAARENQNEEPVQEEVEETTPDETVAKQGKSTGIGGFFSRIFGTTEDTGDDIAAVEQEEIIENIQLTEDNNQSAQVEEKPVVKAFGISTAPVSQQLSSDAEPEPEPIETGPAAVELTSESVQEPETVVTTETEEATAETEAGSPSLFEKLFGTPETGKTPQTVTETTGETPAMTSAADTNETAMATSDETDTPVADSVAETDAIVDQAEAPASAEKQEKGFFASLFGSDDEETTEAEEQSPGTTPTTSGGELNPAEDEHADLQLAEASPPPASPQTQSVDAVTSEPEEEQFGFFDRLFSSSDEETTTVVTDSNVTEVASPIPEPVPVPGPVVQETPEPVEYITDFQTTDAASAEAAVNIGQIRPLATRGDADAQLQLADMYYQGNGLKKDYTQAFLWYRRAAQQGNVDAQYKLGNIYLMGEGIDQDDQQASLWYEKAARQGHEAAQHNYENMQRLAAAQNVASIEKETQPVRTVTPSLAPGQTYVSQSKAGVEDENGDKLPAGEPAANNPNAVTRGDDKSFWDSAGELLGFGDDDKTETTQTRPNVAAIEKEPADVLPDRVIETKQETATADAQSLFDRGMAYAFGDGVRKDYQKAAEYFHQAAEQGHAGAQYRLGVAYAYGEGVERDVDKSLVWYRKAAQQGNTTAQRTIATMYLDGKGVPRDKVMAYAWYRVVADSGNVMDIRRRDMLQQELSGPELTESERIVQEINSRLPKL